MWEELNHSENPFLLSSSFFSTGYIDCNFLPAIWNVSCFKHRVSAACGTNFQTVYSFFIFPSSPEWYHSFKLCFPDRLDFPFIHFDLWLSHMASLDFFLPPKWISFFSHSRWETEGRRNAPSCARCVPEPEVGLRYVRRLFVFSHLFCVCVEFFIPLGFALFPLFCNNQNPVWKVQTLVVISMPQMLAWDNTQCRRFTAGSPHLWGPRVMAAVTESKSWSLST